MYYHPGWHRGYRGFFYCSIGRKIAGGDRAMLSVSIKRFHPQLSSRYKRNSCVSRNTWVSARYLPARIALVALPRSGDSLSRKLEEIHDIQVLKASANPATIRAAASRLYQIPGATNIVDFSFSSYFPSYSTGCVSAIEKICSHVYVSPDIAFIEFQSINSFFVIFRNTRREYHLFFIIFCNLTYK